MPEGSLLISVLRDGRGFVPGPDTVLEAGDEVLAVLDPGREDDLKELFGPAGGNGAARLMAGARGRLPADRRRDGLRPLRSGAAPARRRAARSCWSGREPEPPYERPPLSKEYLRGEAERADAYVNPAEWYEENGVELLTGVNVMSLDPAARTAKLQGGEEVSFGKALIGTGAMVNILRVEGAENEGIHYLRAFGNSDAIRADGEAAEHVVLIGGSYIGTEVAASLTAKGAKCTIVMMEDVALSRTFGEEAGRWFHEQLEANGVTVHGGEELEAFEGDGRVRAVVTKSGLTIECDAVVVGRRSARPTRCSPSGPASRSTTGSSATRSCRPRSDGIYAAGDCCSYDSVVHGRRIRVEHWDVAMQQGIHAAGNMLGEDRDYDVVPYFFSDLADWASLEYVGPGLRLGRGDLARRPRRPASSRSGTSRTAGSRAPSASSAPRTLAEARRMLADRRRRVGRRATGWRTPAAIWATIS